VLHRLASVIIAVALVACGGSGGGGSDDAGVPPADASMASPKANVRFKGNDRLRADFARALALGSGKVCNELGRYSCTHQVHRVQLQGTAPYDLGLYKPLESSTMTAPVAVERIALSACGQRADRDLGATGDPVIWIGLDLQSGKLVDVNAASVTSAITTLYRRALQRDPTGDELDHHRWLYGEVDRIGSGNTARDWAVLSCFSVMTSLEQLFY